MAAVMELLRRKYDLVVVDAGVDRDSISDLQNQADVIVAVARCGTSDKRRFQKMLRSRELRAKQYVIVTDTEFPKADESSESWRLTKIPFNLIDAPVLEVVPQVLPRRKSKVVKAELEDILAPYRVA
jgi:hypothetical protein